MKADHLPIIVFERRFLSYALLLVFLSVFLFTLLKLHLIAAVAIALFPMLLYILIGMLGRPVLAFFVAFVINYFVMGLTRYVPAIKGGVLMDGILLLTLLFSLLRTRDKAIVWSDAINPLTFLTGIWLIYCILLVFNPLTSVADWAAGVRGIAVYLFVFPLLTSILLNQYKYLKIFLFVWSILTLMAVIKVIIQKNFGFDPAEKYWLYVLGGARTHIIYSGIRYFSFFTDAAAFGTSMGLSMTVFFIYAIYCPKRLLQLYYLFISIGAGYGMMVSGTRAAIFIPLTGFLLFILLSKKWKIIVLGIVVLLTVFVFFRYTYIGNGNTEIRRMRSAFHATQDASFNVRFDNQEKMRVFMRDHPFGVGIGKAKRTNPDDYMYGLPTDSSFVLIWVETGILGMLLFLSVFIVVLIRGIHDVMFKIKSKELKGVTYALLAGLAGMMVSGYGNEILQQFPNGPIVYMCMAFIFLGRKFDEQISEGAN